MHRFMVFWWQRQTVLFSFGTPRYVAVHSVIPVLLVVLISDSDPSLRVPHIMKRIQFRLVKKGIDGNRSPLDITLCAV